jgi:hypothetical protein
LTRHKEYNNSIDNREKRVTLMIDYVRMICLPDIDDLIYSEEDAVLSEK